MGVTVLHEGRLHLRIDPRTDGIPWLADIASRAVGTPDSGRPGIVGLDDSGRERLLLEAKFAARLTDQQPTGYLTRLPGDVPSLLLVVAPTLRISSLWVELLTAG